MVILNATLDVSMPFTIWKDPLVYASFPSVAETTHGILLSFRIAPREPFDFDLEDPARQQHLHPRAALGLAYLDRNFAAEEKWLFPVDLFAADQDPNLLRLPDGGLLMSSFSWRPQAGNDQMSQNNAALHEKTSGMTSLFWGGFTALSYDEGMTWTPRQYLPPLPGFLDIVPNRRAWFGGRHRGQAVVLPNGRLLLASYDRKGPSESFCSYLHASDDMGQNWDCIGSLAFDPQGKIGFVEPTLVRLISGDLLALHRSFGAGDLLATCRSSDDGKSWSAPELLDVVGHPYHVIKITEQAALVVYAVRSGNSSIRARLMDLYTGSLDATETTLREGANHRDVGYPTGILVSSGIALVSYYWTDNYGTRYIEGVKVKIA